MSGLSSSFLSSEGRPTKVVLIRPATVTTTEAVGEDAAPPVGLAYIAACLRKCGVPVSIVDGLGEALNRYTPVEGLETGVRHGLSDQEILHRIEPDATIIGVSMMFSLEWPFTRTLVNKIRQRFPSALLVAGGEHITALPEYSLQDCPALDLCVLGEGEQTMVDLVAAFSGGADHREVNGLCYRTSGGYERSSGRKRFRELDSVPRPAWDLVPIRAYLDAGIMTGVNLGRSMPMLASRGCPYRCTFCSNPVMWGPLWRPRDPQEVFDEMCEYMRVYDATNFDFYDLTAIVKRQWIVDFCNLIIKSGLTITWQLPSGTRSEAIDSEVARLLFQSGCRFVNYAPESGSPEMLKLIKKQVDPGKMLVSMGQAINNGISVKANFILGFPGERLGHVWETYRYIMALAWAGLRDVSVFPFSPYPGSELFDLVLQRGLIQLDDQYFYSLSQYTDPRYTKSYCENLSPLALRLLCLFGMGLFYFCSFLKHPHRLLQLIRRVRQGDPKTKLESALVRVLKKRKLKALRIQPGQQQAAIQTKPPAQSESEHSSPGARRGPKG